MKQVNAEKKSVFSLGNVGITSVRAGERISQDVEPIFEVANQFNKFKVNRLAAEVMGLTAGMKIKMLETTMPSLDGRYLVAITDENDVTGAKLGSSSKEANSSLIFNYSGMWAKMIQFDIEATEKPAAYFVANGSAVDKGKTAYMNCKVLYSVVEVSDFDETNPLVDSITGQEYTKVFALIGGKVEAIDMTRYDAKAEEAVEEVDNTTEENED